MLNNIIIINNSLKKLNKSKKIKRNWRSKKGFNRSINEKLLGYN